MTKYEWETELKKNIHRLPPDEIKRVMEYYGELFDDYAERGKRETEIINEFGNPVDVADKILAEFDSENAVAPDKQTEPQNGDAPDSHGASPKDSISAGVGGGREARFADGDKDINGGTADEKPDEKSDNKRGPVEERVILFVMINFLTGFIFFIACAVVWLAVCMIALASVCVAAGGVFTTAVSFGPIATGGVGSGVAQLGIGVAAVGLGILMTVLSVKLIKCCAAATKKIFVSLRNWFFAKKESV